MNDRIRWGILGAGHIAHKFAEGLKSVPEAELVAVGSRSQEKAEAFADEFAIPRRHGSYKALAGDSGVDAVYVATPHPMHKADSILCLEAGKAVLCEKPFTINAAEAAELIAVARRQKLFLMEAMWARFLPSIVRLRELLAAGTIGEVRMMAADFGFPAKFAPESRLFDPALGGGAMMDVGIYPLSLAAMILGPEPAEIATLAARGKTGVDEQSGVVLKYPGGQLAILYSAISTMTAMEATIMGSGGYIRLHRAWWKGSKITVHDGDRLVETIDLPQEGNGYNYEAAEVCRCLREGRTESPVMPLDESLAIMRTLDRIRAAWGLKYPME